MDIYEPTPEEKKNGWTAETLRAYAEERDSFLLTGLPERDKNKNLMSARPTYQVRRHPFHKR